MHGRPAAEAEVECISRREGESWLEAVGGEMAQGEVGGTQLQEGGLARASLGALLGGLRSGNMFHMNGKRGRVKNGYWIWPVRSVASLSTLLG